MTFLQPKHNNMAGGDTISLLSMSDGGIQFCCGFLVAENDTVGCAQNQSSFTLATARLMYGVAALENATLTSDVNASSSSTDTSTASITMASTTASERASAGTTSSSPADGSCQDDSMTIGVGVGVPLGVMALLAVAWGLWERRRRVRSQTTAAAVAGGDTDTQQQASRSYYDKWQFPGGGQTQPAQLATGLEVAEMHARRSPVEMAGI